MPAQDGKVFEMQKKAHASVIVNENKLTRWFRWMEEKNKKDE